MSTSTLDVAQFKEIRNTWIEDEKAALELINVVGKLWFERSVELVLFRNQLFDRSSSEILSLHHYAQDFVKQPINIQHSLQLAKTIAKMPFAPSRIDIGRLGSEFIQEQYKFDTVEAFVTDKLYNFIGEDKFQLKPKDVVLYGFGRIGRLAARELIIQAGKGEQLRLRAIVTRDKSPEGIQKRADLLRSDSVHGPFPGTVVADVNNRCLIVNGHKIAMINASNPEDIDYTAYGIENALLIDNTGILRDRPALSRHLQSKGISQVLLSAPAKGDVPNIVHGINHTEYKEDENIFSAASCTTNAIVPVLKVIQDGLGIERGHIETVHAYTNDQNLLDNFHKKVRRGRAAAVNLVITETGADKAVSKVLPELTGKLTGNAIRVPIPNGSLAVLNLQVSKTTTVEDVNELVRKAALSGPLVEQIKYEMSDELVSSDIISSPYASTFDSKATIVSKDGKSVVLYVWYDNEYGYTRQALRLCKQLAGVLRLRYY
jgi:glyceraldehyde 3-phosphate dehydrogenase